MSLFHDLINYELCFPGAVTGSTEVECPHRVEPLAVRTALYEASNSFEPTRNPLKGKNNDSRDKHEVLQLEHGADQQHKSQ